MKYAKPEVTRQTVVGLMVRTSGQPVTCPDGYTRVGEFCVQSPT